MGLEQDYGRFSSLMLSIEQQQEEADELLRRIREQIKAGATTGDPIQDHVILLHGFDPELVAILHDLSGNLQSHKGQAVLVIKRLWEKAPSSGRERQPVYQLRRTLYFARSTEPFLRFNQELFDDAEITSPFYYSCQRQLLSENLELRRGPVFLSSGSLYKLLTLPVMAELQYLYPQDLGNEIVTEVIVGNRAVNRWMRSESQANPGAQEAYQQMRARLNLRAA